MQTNLKPLLKRLFLILLGTGAGNALAHGEPGAAMVVVLQWAIGAGLLVGALAGALRGSCFTWLFGAVALFVLLASLDFAREGGSALQGMLALLGPMMMVGFVPVMLAYLAMFAVFSWAAKAISARKRLRA